MQLRDYQADTEFEINKAWLAVRNVLAVLPTGAGKTVLFAKILNDHNGAACAIAHRSKLVTQISLALAKFGVSHQIIASKKLVHEIVQLHIVSTGRNYYNPSAKVAVASVKTLLSRAKTMTKWMKSVTLWVQDESHHVLSDNEWGRACKLFPNAKGLGVTATPLRADGAGLGHESDGIMQCLVEGPPMRELIDRGFLTDYKILAPPSGLSMDGVKVTPSGEFSGKQTDDRLNKSHVFGDVIREYLKHARGKLGITFAHNVQAANDIAARFNAAGVPAAAVSYETDLTEQIKILKRFENRQLLQLVNCDLFGEGFDLPAVEVVSFARPTNSFGLFVQQCGRGLRVMVDPDIDRHWGDYTDEQRKYYIEKSIKPKALIIDHVGNVKRHACVLESNGRMTIEICLREWTLDRREKAKRNKHDPDLIPLKTCKACTGLYEAVYNICPYCGQLDVPAERSTIKQVDGDLFELDAATLAEMRGEIEAIDQELDVRFYPSDPKIRFAALKIHAIKQESQTKLREAIKMLGGYHISQRIGQSESWKRFYFRFNIDIMSAQTLKTKEADELRERIVEYLTSVGVVC